MSEPFTDWNHAQGAIKQPYFVVDHYTSLFLKRFHPGLRSVRIFVDAGSSQYQLQEAGKSLLGVYLSAITATVTYVVFSAPPHHHASALAHELSQLEGFIHETIAHAEEVIASGRIPVEQSIEELLQSSGKTPTASGGRPPIKLHQRALEQYRDGRDFDEILREYAGKRKMKLGEARKTLKEFFRRSGINLDGNNPG